MQMRPRGMQSLDQPVRMMDRRQGNVADKTRIKPEPAIIKKPPQHAMMDCFLADLDKINLLNLNQNQAGFADEALIGQGNLGREQLHDMSDKNHDPAAPKQQ